jgi:hypothetical protein
MKVVLCTVAGHGSALRAVVRAHCPSLESVRRSSLVLKAALRTNCGSLVFGRAAVEDCAETRDSRTEQPSNR